jgi:hypothetical protein
MNKNRTEINRIACGGRIKNNETQRRRDAEAQRNTRKQR